MSLTFWGVITNSRTWPLTPSGFIGFSFSFRVTPAALPMVRVIEFCAVNFFVMPGSRIISVGLPSIRTRIQLGSVISRSATMAGSVATGGAGAAGGAGATGGPGAGAVVAAGGTDSGSEGVGTDAAAVVSGAVGGGSGGTDVVTATAGEGCPAVCTVFPDCLVTM